MPSLTSLDCTSIRRGRITVLKDERKLTGRKSNTKCFMTREKINLHTKFSASNAVIVNVVRRRILNFPAEEI